MKNKYERIKLVRDLGLNTEENILIKHNQYFNDKSKFFNEHEKFSLRLFHYDNRQDNPHYPIISKRKVKQLIPQLQNKGYNCILATPINPEDCEFAGACIKTSEFYCVEIAMGSGTVRRVTHENKIDKRYFIPRFFKGNIKQSDIDNKKVLESIKQFQKINLENIIFEFSWYKNLVGYKNENFICWEITDDGTGNSGI